MRGGRFQSGQNTLQNPVCSYDGSPSLTQYSQGDLAMTSPIMGYFFNARYFELVS